MQYSQPIKDAHANNMQSMTSSHYSGPESFIFGTHSKRCCPFPQPVVLHSLWFTGVYRVTDQIYGAKTV